MSLTPTPIIQRPVRERFPNRYTGGYDCSTVTDKLRWQTIRSVKNVKLTTNSNAGGETVVGRKVYPCYCPPIIPVPNPCDSSVAAAFQSINATPFYSCSDLSGRSIVVGSWSVDPVVIKDGLGASVGSLTGIISGSSGFISVFDASGTCDWSAKIEGTSVAIKLVVADSSGNITCVGIAGDGPIIAYSSSGLQMLSPANVGFKNIFVVQYGPNGSLNWIANVVATFLGSYNLFPGDMVVGTDRSIYMSFTSNAPSFQFYNSDDSTGGPAVASGTQYGSLLGISPLGFYMWNTNIMSAGTVACSLAYTGTAVLMNAYILGSPFLIQDPSGNIITFPFPSQYPGVPTSRSTAVAQISLGGVPQWGTVVANAVSPQSSNVPGAVLSFTTETRYVKGVVEGGYYMGSMDQRGRNISFYDTNGTTSVSLPLSSNYQEGGSFVVKMSSSGFTAWAAQILGYRVALYSLLAVTGGVCITGTSLTDPSNNPISFYNAGNTTVPTVTIPSASSFIAKYNSNGNVAWARRISSTLATRTFTLLDDAAGRVYVYFTGSGTFNFYNQAGAIAKTLILTSTHEVLATYAGDGTFLQVTHVGGATFSKWISMGTCNDIYTSGQSIILPGSSCIVYDSSGNQLFAFSDPALNNAITTHWV